MKKFQYKLNNLISRGPRTLMLLLIGLTALFVVIIGFTAFFIRTDGESLGLTLWYTFNHIVDPGYLFGQGNESFWFLVLMTLATFWGILVYSLVISFVSTALLKKLEELRLGRNPIVESNHTLILNYHRAVLTMIEELIEARRDRQKMVIVILSKEDPADIYDGVDRLIKHHSHIKVIVRKGDPTVSRDLAMVSIATCRSVLIASQSDLMTIKILLAVKQSEFMNVSHNFGVCTIEEEKNLGIAKDLAGDQFFILYLRELKTKIMARTCLHPGLAGIYKNIFSFVGEKIYFLTDSRYVHKQFDQLIHQIDGAYPIGIQHQGKVTLNPPPASLIQEGDAVLAIATQRKNIQFVEKEPYRSLYTVKNQPYAHSSRHVLLIGYQPDLLAIILEMEKYVAPASSLTILVPEQTQKSYLESVYINPKFAHLTIQVGETFSRHQLESLHIDQFDTIGVFANTHPFNGDADAETLLTLLHLHQLMIPLTNKPSLVVEIQDASHVDTLAQIGLDDFLVSDVLFSKMMTQISENPHIYPVLEELVSETGQEFYLRRANAYLAANQPYRFQDYIEAGLKKKQLVVGYKRDQEPIVVNPRKDQDITLGDKDRLIILAEF